MNYIPILPRQATDETSFMFTFLDKLMDSADITRSGTGRRIGDYKHRYYSPGFIERVHAVGTRGVAMNEIGVWLIYTVFG